MSCRAASLSASVSGPSKRRKSERGAGAAAALDMHPIGSLQLLHTLARSGGGGRKIAMANKIHYDDGRRREDPKQPQPTKIQPARRIWGKCEATSGRISHLSADRALRVCVTRRCYVQCSPHTQSFSDPCLVTPLCTGLFHTVFHPVRGPPNAPKKTRLKITKIFTQSWKVTSVGGPTGPFEMGWGKT